MDEIKTQNTCSNCNNFLRNHYLTDNGVVYTESGCGDCNLTKKCVNKDDSACDNFVQFNGSNNHGIAIEGLMAELKRTAKYIDFLCYTLKYIFLKRKK